VIAKLARDQGSNSKKNYMVQNVQETSLPRTFNEKYLKKYYLGVWEDA
jgi:hypothetical protein